MQMTGHLSQHEDLANVSIHLSPNSVAIMAGYPQGQQVHQGHYDENYGQGNDAYYQDEHHGEYYDQGYTNGNQQHADGYYEEKSVMVELYTSTNNS